MIFEFEKKLKNYTNYIAWMIETNALGKVWRVFMGAKTGALKLWRMINRNGKSGFLIYLFYIQKSIGIRRIYQCSSVFFLLPCFLFWRFF